MRSLSKSKWMEAVQSYVLYFFFYSVLGWLYEVFLEVVVYRWGFTNRGVLLGPYCPVYGVGALVFLLAFSRLMAKREPAWFRWVKPVMVFLGCTARSLHRSIFQQMQKWINVSSETVPRFTVKYIIL